MAIFTPQRWQAPTAPGLVGEYAENDLLSQARIVPTPHNGPEDVVVDSSGSVFTGTDDGSILKLDGNGDAALVAQVGGRPLGIELYGEDLLVCNADLGLQVASKTGNVEVLLNDVEGARLVLTNNASVAGDGTIYFTESSQRWPLAEYTSDIIEAMPTGRLIRRDVDGTTTVLLDELAFANGVALDATESSVFVAETAQYRIWRYWLSGDKAGQSEVFAENLPGFPDNLSFDGGTLWVAYASPRNPQVDAMGDKTWMKHIAYRLPEALKPKALRHGMVMGHDESGKVTHNLQDPSGKIAVTTSARLANGSLYVGVLTDPHIAIVDL